MPATAAVVFKPDALIDGPNTSNYLGDGQYNDDGSQQTTNARVSLGEVARFRIKFQNDGEMTDDMLVKGCKGSRKFKVTYKLDGDKVTAAVTAGNHSVPLDTSEESEKPLFLAVKVLEPANKGDTKNCKVTATAQDGSASDTVLATGKVR